MLKQNEGEDATGEAEKMLAATEASASVSGVPSDFRAVAGYSVIIQETDTGLYGQFYIESDTHTFSVGKPRWTWCLPLKTLWMNKRLKPDRAVRRRYHEDE